MTMREWADTVGNNTRDGECPKCNQDASECNSVCEEHEDFADEGDTWSGDAAWEFTQRTIMEAREMGTAERVKPIADRVNELLAQYALDTGVSIAVARYRVRVALGTTI
jgi:hypothetical protein